MLGAKMGYFIGQLLGFAIWSLLWAGVLRLGTRKIAKIELTFRKAYVTTLLIYVVSYVCSIVLALLLSGSPNAQGIVPLLTFILAFLAACLVFGFRFGQAEGKPIGLWPGVKIASVLWLAQIVFVAGLVGLVLLFLKPG